MQQLFTLGLTLLAVVPALCWPANDDLFLQEIQEPQQNEYSPEGYNDLLDFADTQVDTEPELPNSAAEELRKALQGDNGGQQAEVEAKSSGRVLGHGCTIGLQLLQNDQWLGCPTVRCGGVACPGVFFEGNDWRNCWGEVFRMYHPFGPAKKIYSGDFVGIYYPHQRNWFSMFQGYGRKRTCPGQPTNSGFANLLAWFHCGAEVFQVYAKGKANGAAITDQDSLAFYYPAGNSYVRFLPGANSISLSQCMLQRSNNIRPPNAVAFDQCKGESVEITIFD